MKNVIELRDELVEVFNLLKEGKMKGREAKEIINCAGKIIASAKLEIDYAKLNGNKREIKFLDKENEK